MPAAEWERSRIYCRDMAVTCNDGHRPPLQEMAKSDRMRVLAIDASLRNSGVAVVETNGNKPRALYFGTIPNHTSLRSSSCLVAIRDRIAQLIQEHEPDCCALESVIYVQSYKTAI